MWLSVSAWCIKASREAGDGPNQHRNRRCACSAGEAPDRGQVEAGGRGYRPPPMCGEGWLVSRAASPPRETRLVERRRLLAFRPHLEDMIVVDSNTWAGVLNGVQTLHSGCSPGIPDRYVVPTSAAGPSRFAGSGVHLGDPNPRTIGHSPDHMDGNKATNWPSPLFDAPFPGGQEGLTQAATSQVSSGSPMPSNRLDVSVSNSSTPGPGTFPRKARWRRLHEAD